MWRREGGAFLCRALVAHLRGEQGLGCRTRFALPSLAHHDSCWRGTGSRGRAYHNYVYDESGLQFLKRVHQHIVDCRQRLKKPPNPSPILVSRKNIELLPVRVLKEEMRLAGLAGYSGLKKADLVARIWGLVEVTSRNAGALEQAQEMGILSGAKGGPVSWRHFERVESALDEEGEGELRPGDRGSGEKRPHGKADLPPSDALADACGRFLSRGRCQDILMIDMKPVCHWTDFMLIATAANEQHVWRATKGLMYQLKRWMPECRWGDVLVDGHSGTDWVNIELIPRGVVNVMTAEARAHYDLEENWVDEKLNNAYKYQGDEPEKRTFTLDELAA